MKFALWGGFVLLAVLWTGGAALLAQLVQWSAQGLASGAASDIGNAAAALTMPVWLAPWFDPAAWAALQQSAAAALEGVAALLPGIGGLVSWLSPLIWVFWGLGLVALLALTLVGNWLIQRLGQPQRTRAQGT